MKTHTHSSSISEAFQARRELRRLCNEAVSQQIESGQAAPTHLRNRRRHLARQVLKKVPAQTRRSPKRLLHAATMVLAMWGFSIGMPSVAVAAPEFKRFMFSGFEMGVSPTPTFVDIDNDGDLDAFVGKRFGRLDFYRNDDHTLGHTSPNFVAVSTFNNPLKNVVLTGWSDPTFVDIDGDGDLDAFVGAGDGTVKFYRNDGIFVAVTGASNPLNGVDVLLNSSPAFVDIDGDNDFDLLVGAYDGKVKFYRNDDVSGNHSQPNFMAVTGAGNPLNGFDVGDYAKLAIDDIDNDGDFDVYAGAGDGIVKFFRNDDVSGNGTAPNFMAVTGAGNPLNGFDVGDYAAPAFADIDNDGDLDAFVGESLASCGTALLSLAVRSNSTEMTMLPAMALHQISWSILRVIPCMALT